MTSRPYKALRQSAPLSLAAGIPRDGVALGLGPLARPATFGNPLGSEVIKLTGVLGIHPRHIQPDLFPVGILPVDPDLADQPAAFLGPTNSMRTYLQ